MRAAGAVGRDELGAEIIRPRQLLPVLDRGPTALVADLEDHGMLADVTIVVWGEFGRTPKIKKNAGRDRWPSVGMALLAGGGMRTGQVLGRTDRTVSAVADHPISYQDVFATLYHQLGLAPSGTTLTDPSGRPQHVIGGKAIQDLV